MSSDDRLGAVAAADRPGSINRETEGVSPEDWAMWTAEIGGQAAPLVSALPELVPDLHSAMLCTLDGLNLCAVGVDDGQVARLAALTSSLYAVSGASIVTGGRSTGNGLDHVTLVSGDEAMVIIAVPYRPVGKLLLWAAARKTSLGVLLFAVRTTGDRLSVALGTHADA